jgi:hypothetical protein
MKARSISECRTGEGRPETGMEGDIEIMAGKLPAPVVAIYRKKGTEFDLGPRTYRLFCSRLWLLPYAK